MKYYMEHLVQGPAIDDRVEEEPLVYWSLHKNVDELFYMLHLCLFFLSLPLTQCASERANKLARDLLPACRSNLSPENTTIEHEIATSIQSSHRDKKIKKSLNKLKLKAKRKPIQKRKKVSGVKRKRCKRKEKKSDKTEKSDSFNSDDEVLDFKIPYS